MGEIIYGKEKAVKLRENIRRGIKKLSAARPPGLEIIIAGKDPASVYYAGLIQRAGDKEGISVNIKQFKKPHTGDISKYITGLNRNNTVDGILVQLPLPKNIDDERIFDLLSPQKDIDGQTPLNQGRLMTGREGIFPATAMGIIRILESNGIEISGKKVAVVGRSSTVGLPAAKMLLDRNATVTICHSKSRPLENYTKDADIVVVSAGRPELVGPEHVKEGACVIDVGTNEVNSKMVGDVAIEAVLKKAVVSPVIGGVGALTLACLFENTFEIYKNHINGIPAK
ncbi:MAG: bifunctional 5,10-methylenetetrahydrofolate dehydrogenase/5,10-methenyltetrahydrofolate cyclohydrolase [Elusimicrobia bacterium]|jgi:methylenetetrahydrofolate dehydrogenase (NADP+)/methenyltetrahydrofolate cyclohydrolase|nr:bifunctional 5,10-methylenetetrahydrofolate dehydrogenase/5,10-methenyltetrahydrofolate cyclohydrolase [Elusimicrobiota bacterium]